MEKIIGNSVLDAYFDETTMSLHMKANTKIVRKKGTPGNWKPVVDKVIIKKKDMEKLIETIYKELESREDGFLEIDRKLSKILQMGPYRIVIVYPPLSDGLEMTIVKPIIKLTIEDYKLTPELFEHLRNESKGILVSGAPGSGKTTFAQALIGVYQDDENIIKTIESPRDLQVDEDIVQYSFTYGTHDEVRDILLLSRPDYTVYDELRNESDFLLYKDLRLTGIGLVGVIHATRPVDSIQRFIGHIDIGIIPQVLDTVIYIDKGKVAEVYNLQLTVKVPEGMESEDLARPVVVISSFLDKKVKYEIYTFGEQVVVMPIWVETGKWKVESKGKNAISEYARQTITQKLQQILPCDFLIKVKWNSLHLYVPEGFTWRIIGKGWSAIGDLEKMVGLSIKVKTFEDLPLLDTKVEISDVKKNARLDIAFPDMYAGKLICLLIGEEVVYFTADQNAIISIKDKALSRSIQKKWFVVVDLDKL